MIKSTEIEIACTEEFIIYTAYAVKLNGDPNASNFTTSSISDISENWILGKYDYFTIEYKNGTYEVTDSFTGSSYLTCSNGYIKVID